MIKIFDTTLRDGEQAPGFSMNLKEKLLLAKQLTNLGVDVIEAGFPNASKDDFEAVKQIAEEMKGPEICALARCKEEDIVSCMKALKNAKKPRIHVFIATSDIHLKHKLKITKDEAIKKAIMGIKLARSFGKNCGIDFSPEDATRSDRKFLIEILREAIRAGADTINIPDTVGYAVPEEFGDLIHFLIENVPGMKKIVTSTHCHNDLGLAVSNSLAGIKNGARQIECTINGIGERAGNASLEEVVMAIKTRPEFYNVKTNINTKQILATSKLLSSITGQHVQANKAIVGRNAFAHEAGIHQHGVLAHRMTYEIMKPEDVGYKSNELIFGKHSGRNALENRLKELGIGVEKGDLEEIFRKFKDLADKKKNIYDEDLILIASNQDFQKKYEMLDAKIISEMESGARAKVKIRVGQKMIEENSGGDGPVDALYAAIIKATALKGNLKSFTIKALTQDREAIGVVNIEWEDEKGNWTCGHGSDTDIVIASGKALIDVLNRREIRRIHAQKEAI